MLTISSPRRFLAQALGPTATSVLEQLPQYPSLIVLNYHRIGEPENTGYDPGVFSATAEQFDLQLSYIKRFYEVLSPGEAMELVDRGRANRAAVAITFDDGYRDNYEVAYPILKSHRLAATFFLPTAFINTGHIPWWDRIAQMLRTATRLSFRLEYPVMAAFDLAAQPLTTVCREVLNLYKHPDTIDPERFERELMAACEPDLPAAQERLFINWDEAAQMSAGGMTIGSHTHRHRLLAKLTPEEQFDELLTSKRIIESQLHCRVTSLAYPVGTRTAFSTQSVRAALDAGYRSAYSFYGGVNRLDEPVNSFDIRRLAVNANLTADRFKLRVSLAGVTGRYMM